MVKIKKIKKFNKIISITASLLILAILSSWITFASHGTITVPIVNDVKANKASISLGDAVTKNGDSIDYKALGIKIEQAYTINKEGEKILAYNKDTTKLPSSGGTVDYLDSISISTDKKTNLITEITINNPIKIIRPITFTNEKTGENYIAISEDHHDFMDIQFTDIVLKCKIYDGIPYDEDIMQYIINVGKLDPKSEGKSLDIGEYKVIPDSADPLNKFFVFHAEQTEKGFVIPFTEEYTIDDLDKYGYLTWTTIGSYKDIKSRIILPYDFLPQIILKIPKSELKPHISQNQYPPDQIPGDSGVVLEYNNDFR